MIISQGVQKLIEKYDSWRKQFEFREEEEVISVDEVAARVASFYEKLFPIEKVLKKLVKRKLRV